MPTTHLAETPAPDALDALDLSKLDPRLIELGLDLYLNILSSDAEPPYRYTALHFDEHDRRVGTAILESIGNGTTKRFTDIVYGVDQILSGFECMAQDLPHEVGLIAWSWEEDPKSFRYLAASGGDVGSVALPVDRAWPHLMKRVTAGIRTRVLVVHNHPRHDIKDTVEKWIGLPLGPSGTDRQTMYAWATDLWVKSNFTIEPEFLLYESGCWRKIRWPAAKQFMAWFKTYGPVVAKILAKERKA